MPFDRLIRAVDGWARARSEEPILAQIGPGAWRPQNMRSVEFLSPGEFRDHVERAKLIVAHAGMGTILTALELGRPLLLMPRRGDLRETRNDHQIATARELAKTGRATIAYDEDELLAKLEHLDQITAPPRISVSASPRLLQAIREFIHGPSSAVAPQAGSGGGAGEEEVQTVAVQQP